MMYTLKLVVVFFENQCVKVCVLIFTRKTDCDRSCHLVFFLSHVHYGNTISQLSLEGGNTLNDYLQLSRE
jgi:hypothetical protein